MSEDKSYDLSGLRVLVAEDELVIALLVEDVLVSYGAEVIGPFASADEALRAIVEAPPDAATLDVNLNGARVYPAARELQRLSVPFIFVTGYRNLPDCPAELAEVPRVTKPFRPQELASTLCGVLETSERGS